MLQVKKLNCPFLRCSNRRSQRPRTEEGYILLIMMMAATLLLISLAAAVPSVYVEGKREREKELIFRGEQYARAIELFHTHFNRYPTSIKELLHTNNMSFLRQRFRDPMVKNGKWRYIYATANGIVLNSKILGPPGKQKGIFGNSKGGSKSQTTNSQPSGQTSQTNSQQNGLGLGTFSLSGSESSGGQSQLGKNSSNFFGDKNKLVGVYIVGVASTSHQQSIGVFDNRTQYDEWEFLGIPGAPGAPNLGVPAGLPAASHSSSGSKPGAGSGFHLGPNPSTQPGAGGGFHLGPSPSSQSGSGSMFGNSNP